MTLTFKTKANHMSINASDFRALVLAAIASRNDYEIAKNAENDNMSHTLKTLAKSFDNDVIAQTMMTFNVSADFINVAERKNARFNVYAAQKVENVVSVLAKRTNVLNHYTLNILRTCAAMSKASLKMTHSEAVASCSKDSKIADAKRAKHVSRYQRLTSANTASTQASSSLNALKVCNVIDEVRDDANNVAYVVRDTDAARELVAFVQA